MSTGWIKLHRQFLEWEWYSDMNTKCLFLHCLLRANHTDTKWRGIEVKRGQFITSLETLSKETGLSVQMIRTSLSKLKSTGNVTSKQQAKARILTIPSYDSYQDSNKEANRQATGKQQAINREVTTDKNVITKEDKNKEIYQQIAGVWNEIFPSLPQVVKVSQKRKSHITASVNEFKKDFGFDSADNWKGLFEHAAKSDFLMGRTTNWSMDFDFIINKANLLKIIEGNYDNT